MFYGMVQRGCGCIPPYVGLGSCYFRTGIVVVNKSVQRQVVQSTSDNLVLENTHTSKETWVAPHVHSALNGVAFLYQDFCHIWGWALKFREKEHVSKSNGSLCFDISRRLLPRAGEETSGGEQRKRDAQHGDPRAVLCLLYQVSIPALAEVQGINTGNAISPFRNGRARRWHPIGYFRFDSRLD